METGPTTSSPPNPWDARFTAACNALCVVFYLWVEPAIVIVILFDGLDRGWADGERSPLARIGRKLGALMPAPPADDPGGSPRAAARIYTLLAVGMCLRWWPPTIPVALSCGLAALGLYLLEAFTGRRVGWEA